jgi:hypothetical protein
MIPVTIESPYASDVGRNVKYAKRAVLDCLARGEAPYASHLFFTQEGILDDKIAEERKLGIEAGFAISDLTSKVVFYVDYGWSQGMISAYYRAIDNDKPFDIRTIGENP